MSQPKLPLFYRMSLMASGLQAYCYQPPSLFPNDKRKLPNVPVPTDPWEVFLRRDNGEYGIVGRGVGATLEDALQIALQNRTGQGLVTAMRRLGEQMDCLSEVINAGED